MKRLLLNLTLLLILIVGVGKLNSQLHAQTTYDILLDNYQQSFDDYKTTRDDYIEARAEFLKYGTLVSKTIAIEATQKFLPARQKVLINYLKLMKERLEQSPELTEEELKPKIQYINDEIEFLEKQIPYFDSAADLKDLIAVSKNTENRAGKYTTQAYRMQGLVITSKVRSLRKTAEELIKLVGEQVSRIKKEGIIDTSDIDRWLLEAPDRIVLAQTKEETGLKTFNNSLSADDSRSIKNAKYGVLQGNLSRSNQYLKEAKDFLLEIMQDIRFD